MVFRLISLILSLSLFCQQAGIAYASGELNLANYLSSMRNAAVQPDIFQPARLRYISYDSRNNDFKLLLDKGNIVGNGLEPFPTQQEEAKLFNYFLIGLALPNDTFWVNLRPDAPENIIDPLLEKTDIGKIFLEADLQLKKDTASLTSPQNPEGKAYWDKLYKKAGELFGTENITIPTITRPWIVPNEVIVRETEDSAYIYKATLKVMLEADYLKSSQLSAGQKAAVGPPIAQAAFSSQQYNFKDSRLKELNEYSSQIIRETIIPKLTREVNSSKRYAKLRQVYYSLVLSRWFKQKYSSLGSARAQGASAPVNSYIGLIDSGNLANLNSRESCDKQTYFQAYQKSFKDGEYNLKETVVSPYGQSIRSYISGGIRVGVVSSAVIKILNNSAVTDALKNGGVSSGSPVFEWKENDVRQGLREIYRNYSGIDAAMKIIKLFIGGDEKGDYIKYLEDTESALLIFEKVKGLDESLQMAFNIFKKASEHSQRNEKGELIHGISVELNKEGFLDAFAKLEKKMEKLKENPYRLPWIKKILGQIDIFLDEFSDIKAPEIVSQLRKIKREIGDSTHHIDVNKKWKGGAREYLMGIVDEKQGNVQKALKNAVNEIDKIIEDHQKDDDIESGNISGSPLTVEDIRKVKVELKKYAKTLSNFYEGLSSVDLTNGIEQGRFSEDYKNYSRDLAETLNIKELMDAVSIAVELTGDKRPSGYTAAEWQEIYGDLAGLKERIDLTLEKYIAELVELFGDKEEGLYKYFLQIEKDRLDDYNQKYGQRSKLRNIATAIEAANTAVRLYEKGNIDVRERWEDAAAVLKEIDSIIGQWLDNKHKVRSSLSILKRSIEEWYNGLSDDVREKWLSTIRQEMRDIQLPGLTNIQEDISKYDPVKSILIVIDEYVKKLDEGKINSRADLNAFINERVMVYMLSAIDFHLKRYQSMVGIEELRGIEGLRKEDADKLNIVLDVFKDEMMNVVGYNYVSSSVAFSPLIEFKILLGNAREVIKGIVDSGSMLSGMFYYLEKNGELIDRELLLGLVVGFEKQIVGLRNNLKENRRLEQDKQKYYEAKIKQIIKDCDNLISVLKEIVAKQASSAMISPVGGIDFTGRAMRLKIERVGSFADLKLVLPAVKNAQDIDLDKEFRQIEAIASSGLVPNSRRILELFSACYARGEFGRRLPQVISCLKASSAIQESLAIDSDADFRLALIAPEVFADGR